MNTHFIRLNPFNYNVWIYRRKILKFIKNDPQKELCLSEEIIRNYPKNIQAWEHRRAIINSSLNFTDAETEFNLTQSILKDETKNYFAWQHRQWALQTFRFSHSGPFGFEFDFTDNMISEDVRNNSAWNQRFYVLKQQGRFDFLVVKKELCYVIEKIKQTLNNESTWNFLRGIIDVFPNSRKLPIYDEFLEYLNNEFYSNKNHCPQLVSFIIDVNCNTILESDRVEMVLNNKVQNLCLLMAEQFDTIRSSYWKYVFKKLLFDKSNDGKRDMNVSAKSNATWKYKIWKKYENDE